MKKRGKQGLLYILPGFSGLCIFYIIPFFISLRYVFTRGIRKIEFSGLENFKELMNNPAFCLAAQNTIIFTAIAVPLLTGLSLFLAIILQDSQNRFIRWALLTPMMMPVASALLGWEAIFTSGGLLDKIIQAMGGAGQNYLQDPYARPVLILVFLIKNLGYMTLIFSGAISSMNREYREVFVLDSNSILKYLFYIVIPMLSPVIFFVSVISTVNCFQIFREVNGLYGDYPPDSLYMLQNFMNNNFEKLNYSKLCTAAFLVSIIIAVVVSLYLCVQNKAIERESGL